MGWAVQHHLKRNVIKVQINDDTKNSAIFSSISQKTKQVLHADISKVVPAAGADLHRSTLSKITISLSFSRSIVG